MQPLTLSEQRIIESIIRSGMTDLEPHEIEAVKKALAIALQTNEALKAEWIKYDNKTAI